MCTVRDTVSGVTVTAVRLGHNANVRWGARRGGPAPEAMRATGSAVRKRPARAHLAHASCSLRCGSAPRAPSRGRVRCFTRFAKAAAAGAPGHVAHDHSHDDHDHSHEPDNSPQDIEAYLDSLKWDDKGFVVAIAQHVDSGAVLMQAFANRTAVKATLETGLGTFYSRSRKSLWCKGETSGNVLRVQGVYVDCDADSLIYLCDPVGPACHTGAPTCWFAQVAPGDSSSGGSLRSVERMTASPLTTLHMLEDTIRDRQGAMASDQGTTSKPSWTARLLSDPDLLCSKVREEADELCAALTDAEGKERTASEMADVLYHAMVLLRAADVELDDVLAVLRKRFGRSGIDEKAARKKTTSAP